VKKQTTQPMAYKIICTLIAGSFLSLSVQAMELFSNLVQPSPYPGEIDEIHVIGPGETYASAFYTTDGYFTVDSVTFEYIAGFPDPATYYPDTHVYLFKEVPGPVYPSLEVVTELVNPTFDPTPTVTPEQTVYVKFFPIASAVLEPYAPYWVGFQSSLNMGPNGGPGILFSLSAEYSGFCTFQNQYFYGLSIINSGEFEERNFIFGGPKYRLEGTPVGDLPICNLPPDLSNARASVDQIWPPNERMVNISIIGITDPDGDRVSLSIWNILQDEPSLNSSFPDAEIVSGSSARVRAERNEEGTGRFYKIFFTVTDGKPGHTIDGYVFVTVPHDQNHAAVNEGEITGTYHLSYPQ
jgi:hypothetical protein